MTESIKDTSEIVCFAMEAASSFLEQGGINVDPNAWVTVRSNGFRIGKLKLGLGSSAAVAASAVGAIFEAHGLSIENHLDDLLDISIAAHRRAQQGQGSGVDVASSVMGGTIIYAMSKRPIPVTLTGLRIVVVFSGRPVSTEDMLRSIEMFESLNPKGHLDCMSELMSSAAALSSAYREGDAPKIIAASREYGACMGRLGRAARVNIITKEHQCAMTLAHEIGGAAKPSGAGGGDIAVALFDSDEAAVEFRKQCVRHELTPLDLEIGVPGLRVENHSS
jgi:phosphomevalonate kinase